MTDLAGIYGSRGVFVRQQEDGGYRVIAPPVGASVEELPRGAIPIEQGSSTFQYSRGAFYQEQADAGGYVVVRAPVGAAVPSLPPGASKVVEDGVEYMRAGGVYYKALSRRGRAEWTVARVSD